MHYPELATVQARLTYRLTSFLLENLATEHTVEWMDAFRAQHHLAEIRGIADRELPWLATRVDPRGRHPRPPATLEPVMRPVELAATGRC